MRNITFDSVESFKNGENFRRQNTEVQNGKFFLHGNKIAELNGNNLFITCAGWTTNTTKERLNGILKKFNLGYISQKNWEWFYTDTNGKTIEFPNAGLTFKL